MITKLLKINKQKLCVSSYSQIQSANQVPKYTIYTSSTSSIRLFSSDDEEQPSKKKQSNFIGRKKPAAGKSIFGSKEQKNRPQQYEDKPKSEPYPWEFKSPDNDSEDDYDPIQADPFEHQRRRAENVAQMKLYRKSQELADLLKEKVALSNETDLFEYTRSKLEKSADVSEFQQTSVNKVLAKSLSQRYKKGEEKKSTADIINELQDEAVQKMKDNDETLRFDSYTGFGTFEGFGLDAYQAASGLDYFERMKRKQVRTYKQHQDYMKQQEEKEGEEFESLDLFTQALEETGFYKQFREEWNEAKTETKDDTLEMIGFVRETEIDMQEIKDKIDEIENRPKLSKNLETLLGEDEEKIAAERLLRAEELDQDMDISDDDLSVPDQAHYEQEELKGTKEDEVPFKYEEHEFLDEHGQTRPKTFRKLEFERIKPMDDVIVNLHKKAKEGPIFDDKVGWQADFNQIKRRFEYALKWSWMWAGCTEEQAERFLEAHQKDEEEDSLDWNMDEMEPDLKEKLEELEQKGITKEMITERAKIMYAAQEMQEEDGLKSTKLHDFYEEITETHKMAVNAFNDARNLLMQTISKKNSVQDLLTKQSNNVEGHSGPKASDYIGHERQLRKQTTAEVKENIKYLMKQRGNTQDGIKNYDHELKILSKLAILNKSDKKEMAEIKESFEFIFSEMRKNGIEETYHTQARIFEYAAMSGHYGLADAMLKKLTSNDATNVSPIDHAHLEQYYLDSLRNDHLNGVALGINYAKAFGLNISNWNLSACRSGLDYYLNHSRDDNKLMTYIKLYTYFYDCRTKNLDASEVQAMDDKQLMEQHDKIFGDHADLVDMRSLFKHLINKFQGKMLIDPNTHEDELWNLCKLFAKPQVNRIAKMSPVGDLNNSLDSADMVRYIESHFENGRSFERAYQLAVHLDGADHQYTNHMLRALRNYQQKHSKLPFSFNEENIAEKYLQWKASGKKLSDNTAELMLYLLKSNQMWDQLIDLCDNFDAMVDSGKQVNNHVRDYYLADALLQMPIDSSDYHYNQLIEDAVFESNVDANEPNKITAMTKAYFKDGAPEQAVAYFQSHMAQRRQHHTQRENLLVSMYDSVYSAKADLSFDEFKARYLTSIEMSNRILKESYAVGQIQSIIANKDYDQIDKLFTLYTVMKQERQLLMLDGCTGEQFDKADYFNMPIEQLDYLKPEQQVKVEELRQRRQALQSLFADEENKSLQQMLNIIGDQNLSILQGANQNTFQRLQEILGTMSATEAQEMLKRSNQLLDAAQAQEEENANVFKIHKGYVDNLIKDTLLEFGQDTYGAQSINEDWIEGDLRSAFESYGREQNNVPDTHKDDQVRRDELYKYVHEMEGKIDVDYDPLTIMKRSHEFSIAIMKEQLLEALTNRKEAVLPLALGIFNKIQSTQVKQQAFASIDDMKNDNLEADMCQREAKSLNENIDQLSKILNDQRSPILSTLKDTTTFCQDALDPWKAGKLTDEVCCDIMDRLDVTMDDIQSVHEYADDVLEQSRKLYNQIQNTNISKKYDQLKQKNQKKLSEHLDQRILNLYQQFKRQHAEEAEKNDEVALQYYEPSRQQKISLMRDTLQIELGAPFTSQEALFPNFYAEDLIIFGLNNNSAEAIRLGEGIMSENQQTLSRALSEAIKEWQLNHASEYRDAIRVTGPIDNTRLHFKGSRDSDPVIGSLDDPYWQDFLQKNTSRANIWKTPSNMAWDYKPRGILDELIDFDALKKNVKGAQARHPYIHIANM